MNGYYKFNNEDESILSDDESIGNFLERIRNQIVNLFDEGFIDKDKEYHGEINTSTVMKIKTGRVRDSEEKPVLFDGSIDFNFHGKFRFILGGGHIINNNNVMISFYFNSDPTVMAFLLNAYNSNWYLAVNSLDSSWWLNI